jgi:hypothetical protein
MTVARSILIGCPLCLGTLLAGCPFEEPPVIQDSEGSGTAGDATTSGTSTTTPTTTTPTTTTTDGPTTDATTVDPTTVGPLDTTADSTTSEVTVTDSSSSSGSTGDPCVPACDGIACGMVDACDCGECGPMAMCTDDQSYCAMPIGYFNDFGFSASVGGQLQLGFRFPVFAPTTVRRLGLIAWGAGANVRLALYDHDGVGPANRLVQTGAVMLYANGNNEFDVGATPIAPGDYWVMVHTEGNTPLRRTPNGDNGYEEALRAAIPFAAGFPVAMNDEMVITDYRYNLYMVVEE